MKNILVSFFLISSFNLFAEEKCELGIGVSKCGTAKYSVQNCESALGKFFHATADTLVKCGPAERENVFIGNEILPMTIEDCFKSFEHRANAQNWEPTQVIILDGETIYKTCYEQGPIQIN